MSLMLSEWRNITLGSHGCDFGAELKPIDELPDEPFEFESDRETMRTSRQFEYVSKCGINFDPM